MSTVEKYLSEALLKEAAKKKVGIIIKDGAVDSSKIADGAVSTAKIADSAISTAKIADGAVSLGKVGSGVLAAENISFTTTDTGLTGTNLQDVSKELQSNISTLDTDLTERIENVNSTLEGSLDTTNTNLSTLQKSFSDHVENSADSEKALTDRVTTLEGKVVTVDSELSSTSTNAIQNKAVNTALSGKVDAENPTIGGTLTLGASSSGDGGLLTITSGSNPPFSAIEVFGHSSHIGESGYIKAAINDITNGGFVLYPLDGTNNSIYGKIVLNNAGTINLPYVASGNTDTLCLKSELDAVTAAAGSVTVDSELSSSSVNPVQNKIIYNALLNKANVSAIPTVDSALSEDSENPVQNQAIYAALAEKDATIAALQTALSAVQNSIYGITLGSDATELTAQYDEINQLLDNNSTSVTYKNEGTTTTVTGIYGKDTNGTKITMWKKDVPDQGGSVVGTEIRYGYTDADSAPDFQLFDENNALDETNAEALYGGGLYGLIVG